VPNTKLIKYPGSKNALVSAINKVFRESGKFVFVDVFGGSGIVSLNVDADRIVYNDLNREIYNLFKVIKSSSDEFLQVARKWTSTRDRFDSYGEMLSSGKVTNQNNVESAFRTFYKFNVGFGGMGSTYRTKSEKSSYSTVLKVLSNYKEISLRISKWTVENVDFRELIGTYDGGSVFFYLDPPYIAKSWYDIDFNYRALEDLKRLTRVIKGSYLCTFDYNDLNSREVFGKPDHVAQFVNQNRQKTSPQEFRNYSLYYSPDLNFK
jgi:DNA adenine methylase